MSTETRSMPAAGCAKCGCAVSAGAAPGAQCTNLTDEGPCDGEFRASTGNADWMMCMPCNGRGMIENLRCDRCDGSGWHYARPRFP